MRKWPKYHNKRQQFQEKQSCYSSFKYVNLVTETSRIGLILHSFIAYSFTRILGIHLHTILQAICALFSTHFAHFLARILRTF